MLDNWKGKTMSDQYMRDLEENVYAAIETLEKERYYEFSRGLLELIHQAKHYQGIGMSLLDTHCGVPSAETNKRFEEARTNKDWY